MTLLESVIDNIVPLGTLATTSLIVPELCDDIDQVPFLTTVAGTATTALGSIEVNAVENVHETIGYIETLSPEQVDRALQLLDENNEVELPDDKTPKVYTKRSKNVN